MVCRRLGTTGLEITPLGFGAFKIGRNEKIKYERSYPLPSEEEVSRLLNAVLDLGINYIDTAPAYGVSEQRIGDAIGHRNDAFVVSTKVGEVFERGRSTYDFSSRAIRESVHRSLTRLRREVLDLVFIHSDGRDLAILNQTDAPAALQALKDQGLVRAIGFSGKTIEGARASLTWADAIMVEYHLDDRSHADVISEAASREIGVVVKKGLASGRLPATDAIEFVLANQAVTSLVIGGLNLQNIQKNLAIAAAAMNHSS